VTANLIFMLALMTNFAWGPLL